MKRTRLTRVSEVTALVCGLAVALGACQGRTTQPGGGGRPVVNSGAATDTPAEEEAVNVRLNVLSRARPDVAVQPRNPFRFDRRAPARPSSVPTPTAPPNAAATLRQIRTPVRVPLQLIGLIASDASGDRIAVLTDGDHVFHGQTGDIVEGRYRIVAVGPMSAEIEAIADGRRDVLRLAESR